jgi:DNA polymerase elongation subunit (family B)
MMDEKPKILTIDIETAPNTVHTWGLFKQNVSVNQIVEPGYILCFAAKWLGDKEVISRSKWEHGYKEMLQVASDLITEADAIVTKNGKRFDLPWLQGEFIRNGVALPPPTTHIDLEETVRKQFRFASNKLEYIAPYLGVGRKVKHEGFELWTKVIDGNPTAQRKMMRYCVGDVRVTERLYLKIRPGIVNHPHMGFTPKRECGACGSAKVHVSKWRRTRAMRIQQLHCQSCGSYFDGIRQKV